MLFTPNFIHCKGKLKQIAAGVELGIWAALGFMTQSIALQNSPASKVSLFCALTVLMPPIFYLIEKIYKYFNAKISNKDGNKKQLNDKRLNNSKRKVMKIASNFVSPLLAICGACILVWGEQHRATWTDVYLLITPVSFALNFWRSSKFAVQYPSDTRLITFSMLFSVTLISGLWAIFTNRLNLQQLCTNSSLQNKQCMEAWQVVLKNVLNQKNVLIPHMLYNGFVATGYTSSSEQKAIKVLSANEVTLIYTLEPIFTTLFAAVFLNEKIGFNTCAGAFFIIFACIWEPLLFQILILKNKVFTDG
jgi:drug/metabolite transporter (DMT)-like permease